MSADDDNNWQELSTGMKSRDDCFKFTCCFILSAFFLLLSSLRRFSFVLLFLTLALWPICVHVCRRQVHSVFESVSSVCRSFSLSCSHRRYTFTCRAREPRTHKPNAGKWKRKKANIRMHRDLVSIYSLAGGGGRRDSKSVTSTAYLCINKRLCALNKRLEARAICYLTSIAVAAAAAGPRRLMHTKIHLRRCAAGDAPKSRDMKKREINSTIAHKKRIEMIQIEASEFSGTVPLRSCDLVCRCSFSLRSPRFHFVCSPRTLFLLCRKGRALQSAEKLCKNNSRREWMHRGKQTHTHTHGRTR